MRSVPYFIDSFPQARRREYPRLRGNVTTRVVIAGGGLTGCACAAVFAAAGIDAVLIEEDRLGAGSTARSAGLLRQDFDASFIETVATHGVRTSRHVWQGFRRASLDLSAVMRRLRLRADLIPQDLVLLPALGTDEARALQREYQARRDAGVDASWLTARALASETAIERAGAVRTKGDALDPYRACLALADTAAAKGVRIHERTMARRIKAGRKSVEVKTDEGLITAEAVILATGRLPADLSALRRHFPATESYAVVTETLPASVRRALGKRTAALRDTAVPPHLLRWTKDDRILFAGAEQSPVPARLRDRTLVQRANQLMYELSVLYPAISGLQPEWAWDVLQYGSPDGLPVIGPHRNFPRHLFALGHGRHGAGAAWLSAKLLLRAFQGEPAKGDELFGFARIL